MRISDWSSDVCSSDLFADRHRAAQRVEHADLHRFGAAAARRFVLLAACADHPHAGEQRADQHLPLKPLAHIVLRLNFAPSASRADAATSPDKSYIGRAHDWTPVTNAHLVCRLLLDKKK